MRKGQHYVSSTNWFIFEKYVGGIAFAALQPEQALRASGTDDIRPHQSHIHEWPKPRKGAISGEHILHWQDRMATAEHMHQTTPADAFGHHRCSLLDVFCLCSPDSIQNFGDAFVIASNAQNDSSRYEMKRSVIPLKSRCDKFGRFAREHPRSDLDLFLL